MRGKRGRKHAGTPGHGKGFGAPADSGASHGGGSGRSHAGGPRTGWRWFPRERPRRGRSGNGGGSMRARPAAVPSIARSEPCGRRRSHGPRRVCQMELAARRVDTTSARVADGDGHTPGFEHAHERVDPRAVTRGGSAIQAWGQRGGIRFTCARSRFADGREAAVPLARVVHAVDHRHSIDRRRLVRSRHSATGLEANSRT